MSPHHEGGAITYTEKGNKAYGHILGDHENIFLEQWILKKIFQGMFCTHRSSYSWKLIIIWNYGLSVMVCFSETDLYLSDQDQRTVNLISYFPLIQKDLLCKLGIIENISLSDFPIIFLIDKPMYVIAV